VLPTVGSDPQLVCLREWYFCWFICFSFYFFEVIV
jgi:hypothetical protein